MLPTPPPSTPPPSTEDSGTAKHRPPDLRLAGLATGTWLGILAAIALGSTDRALAAAAMVGICGLVLALVALRGNRSRPLADEENRPGGDGGRVSGALMAIAMVLLGMCCGGVTALRIVEVGTGGGGSAGGVGVAGGVVGRLVAMRAAVRMDVTVTDDPRLIGGGGTGSGGGHGWWVMARLESVVVRGRVVRVGAPVTVTGVGVGAGGAPTTSARGESGSESQGGSQGGLRGERWRGLLPGQRVRLVGVVGESWGAGMGVAAVRVVGGVGLGGEAPWYQRWAGRVREGLRRACVGLPGGVAVEGLLPGLVDGDTTGLDAGVRQRFLVAGMSHLMAVSGANLAVVLGFVVFVGRWVRWGARVGAGVGLVVMAGFVVLVRPEPSVVRAAVMGGLGLVGVVLRRPGAAVPGLAAGVFVLLVVDPGLAASAGFALSTLATVGLLLFGVAWRDRLRGWRVPRGVAEAIAVPLAAQVACAPVIAAISGSVGIAAVPANLLAEPAVAPATVLGVGAAAVSPVSPWLAHALAWLAAWPCRWLLLVAGWSDRPASLVPWPSGAAGGLLLAAALLAALLLATAHRATGWVLLALAAGALPAWLLTASWPHPA